MRQSIAVVHRCSIWPRRLPAWRAKHAAGEGPPESDGSEVCRSTTFGRGESGVPRKALWLHTDKAGRLPFLKLIVWRVSRRKDPVLPPHGPATRRRGALQRKDSCCMSVQHKGFYDDMPGRWLFEALSPTAQSSRQGKKRKRRVADAETASGPDGRAHWSNSMCCLEEIEAHTMTSNCPKTQGYKNLQRKMYLKCQKQLDKL
ncbi:hypothetical protein E2562_038959 [Oryza meyeriana var. granulata]|uniref:Uncharacterized protein n=1 Tax=Oryza meyeriana var. granulata TaxID=110450 RepID=A0A6G1DB13_9ORYZ|nr:hypothetical protein E2562_038959 [Oryza meyeriana var. granulata]